MTLRAVQAGVCAGQWESRQIVVKCCRQPAAGGMAGGAVRTEPAIVIVILLVAGIAVGGRTPKDVVDMTVLTGDCSVFTGQFEGEQIVIYVGRQPAGGGVAGGAVCSELAVVFIILLMAGIAVGGCALENVIDMTILAGNLDV